MAQKKTASKKRTTKKSAPKYPSYLDKKIPEFTVGTEDYRNLVGHCNELFNTNWRVNRVAPAVFMGIYRKLRKHYNLEG